MRGLREEMERGTDPGDPRVQTLAKKFRALIDEFTGGDAAIEQSLQNMYRGEPQLAQQQGTDAAMNDYIRRALASVS